MDRLLTELKLPPADAYHKLRHTIEEVNNILLMYAQNENAQIEQPTLDPIKGNVTFSACIYGWSFTLDSFSQLYCDVFSLSMDYK